MNLLERTMQNTLHTVLLLSFQRAGGLETIFDICSNFLNSIESVTNVKTGERSESMVQELVHAQGGLKVALHLLYPLVSSKALFESGQTILVMTRDKKDTDADYFEPHHFLVRLRLASIPVLQRMWESSWLRSAPLTLVKSVIQLVLELTAAENEELKGEPPGEGIPGAGSAIGIAAGLHMRNTGPDENRIRQLTEMGFPRSAAERALARAHNNVTAATDLLLSHPFPLPPDPEPSDTRQNEVEGGHEQSIEPTAEDADESTTRDEEMESEEVGSSAPPEALVTPVSSEMGKSLEELRQELNAAREPLKAGLTRQALLLVDEHPSLIFEVHKAFLRPSPDLQDLSIRSLIDDIKEYSPGALDVQEEPLATRCRLLALVLSECPTLDPSVGRNLMDCLLALLLSNSSTMEPDHSTPKWLASHLLVTEALLNIGDQPVPIVLPKEGDPIVPQDLKLGPPYPDARSIVFDFCIRLLALPNLPRDEFLATLRLLVVLSRDHNVASKFVKRNGISLIFKHLKVHGGAGSYSYIAIILRHVAEDLHTLQGTMRQEIKRFLSQPRTRIVDVSSLVRNCSAVALRNTESFIEVIQSICQLQQPYSAIQHISLKPDVAGDATPSNQEGPKHMDMQVDSPTDVPHAPSNEALESVVHFLISELMKTYKPPDGPADAVPQTNKQQPTPALPAGKTSTQPHPDTLNEQERYAHCCFLMQCLSELLFSYDACKLAFLSYNPKKQRQQTPSKDGKYRTAVLQFFLSELVTYGTIAAQPDAKARLHLCTWAMSVLVALCVDCSPGAETKEVPADLVSIRKFVLDAISKAIKETSTSESMDPRYGRFLALTDLCNRLLTVRFSTSTSRKPLEESTTHIAKIMLEKNFVATLTNALGEVDLNFPNIRNLVASVLRPLENL